MTNGDRIRQMSDKELAIAMLFDRIRYDCEGCPAFTECESGEDFISCTATMLKWLKSEEEEK